MTIAYLSPGNQRLPEGSTSATARHLRYTAMTEVRKHLSFAEIYVLKLFLVILIFVQIASSQPGNKQTAAVPLKANALYLNHARKSVATLNKTWLSQTSNSVTWTGINAWQRFVIADSLMEYTKISGEKTLLPDIELAVANKDGLDGNDDDLWAVISSLNLYELTRSPALLQFAETKYKQLTGDFWDNTCGGGMWWDHQRTYKNAITNELLLYASTLLYRATGQSTYYSSALSEWNWFSRSGLINGKSLINDGLDKHCANNGQTTYTYNQGVILGALTNLSLMDQDPSHIALATKIAKAAISDLSNSEGILVEPVADLAQDGQIFKGIFAYHLGHLFQHVEDESDRKVISVFVRKNANKAWTLRKPPNDQINAYWDNAHSLYGAAAQASGVDLLDAAAEVTK